MTLNNDPSPPRWSARLVGRLFPDAGGCSLLGDMTESFRRIAGERGLFRARMWFRIQAFRALFAFAGDLFFWRTSMLKNYLTVALRNLKKNRMYSILNLTGLAAGLAAFFLIALYVRYELSFDRYHDKADRIYSVGREKPTGEAGVYISTAVTPAALGPALEAGFPEIEAVTRIIKSRDLLVSNGRDHLLEEEFYWVDPATFKIFTLPPVKGDTGSALRDPASIWLSERAALKYFGKEDPRGQTLTVQGSTDFRVEGVFQNMPDRSHFVMDLVAPYETYFRITGGDINGWSANFSYTYLLLREDGDAGELVKKFPSFMDRTIYNRYKVEDKYKNLITLQSLPGIHLHSHRVQEIGVNSDIATVYLFSSLAVLVLLIACLNYMNLATARSLQRSREAGLRKVVGAGRGQLIRQYLGEALTMSGLALILAVGLTLAALPLFARLVQRPLRFAPAADPVLYLGLILVVFLVGVFSGSYPALSFSSVQPISVLGRTLSRDSRGSTLRNTLVLAQFSVTIVFFVFAFVVRDQLSFIKNRDMGYDREQILTLRVRDRDIASNIDAVRTELERLTGVTGVAACESLPNAIDTHTMARWPGQDPDAQFPIYYNTADYDFVDLFGIEIMEGRNFSRDYPSDRTGAFLINQAAAAAAGWESPVGREFVHWRGDRGKIVGVMKDFHLHSLHRPIEPLYIFLDPGNFAYLSIKLKPAAIPDTIDNIEKVMKKFSPHYPFEYAFFDELFQRAYEAEQRVGGLFRSISALAVLIACLGLFGLSAFAAERRVKEIGVRKVLGASAARIVLLFSREFIRWVLLANLIAWPVAYLAAERWLRNFVYRVDVGIGIFLLSGALALLVAVVTVSFQSVKAAVADPIRSLRYE